jgi:hypothetical protein
VTQDSKLAPAPTASSLRGEFVQNVQEGVASARVVVFADLAGQIISSSKRTPVSAWKVRFHRTNSLVQWDVRLGHFSVMTTNGV